MNNKRMNIFVGHFGSGKTEIAINFAYKLREKNLKTVLIDCDVVNPFFRTADAEDELKKRDIELIKPMYANTNIDVPALPAGINKVFGNKDMYTIFDVGGDDLGAKGISRYKEDIEAEEYELYLVINTRRPLTSTKEKIKEMILDIEQASRLKVTRLVNNTNILKDTSLSDIQKGHEIIDSVAKELNIPIGFVAVTRIMAEGVRKVLNTEVLVLDEVIKKPWDKEN